MKYYNKEKINNCEAYPMVIKSPTPFGLNYYGDNIQNLPVVDGCIDNGSNKIGLFSENIFFTSKYNLVDSGTSYRDFVSCANYTYAVEGVDYENNGWANFLGDDHFLHSYTRQDFKNNSGLITLTAFDSCGPQTTVQYNTKADTITCGCCGAPTSGTLTSNRIEAYVCQHLSSTDFSSLVRAVAFPEIFTLFTNEIPLGWCSRALHSFSPEKKVYWEYYKYKNK